MHQQPQIEPGDRKILIVAGVILAGFVLAGFLFYPPSARFSPGFPSSYSASSGGGKAAYFLLRGLGCQMKRWTRPPEELPEPEKDEDVVLVLAHPLVPPSAEDEAAIRSFVAQGGRVLATGWTGASLVGGHATGLEKPWDIGQEFRAEAPAPLTRRAPKIRMESRLRWSRLGPRQQRYYGDQHGAVVVSYKIGRGRVVWWASAGPLTNYGLTQASNMMLFLNSVGIAPQKSVPATASADPTARPKKTVILWDEYFHGQEESLWGYFAATPLPWAGLQFMLLGAAAIIAYGRRLGPLRPLAATGARFSPLEFVDALAGLYQRKGDGAGALQIAYEQFKYQLARHFGLPSKTTTNEDLASAARDRLGDEDSSFRQALDECEQCVQAGHVPEVQAFRLIQELHDYAMQFGLITPAGSDR